MTRFRFIRPRYWHCKPLVRRTSPKLTDILMNFKNPSNLINEDKQFNLKQAIRYQKDWAALISTEDTEAIVERIAGIDIAYDLKANKAYAIVVVLDANSLAIVEIQKATTEIKVPYRSGFLSFREVPAITEAFDQLSKKPDLIVCDGQGRAHPRRFGLACHLGLIYDLPTIGCGKTRLFGSAALPGEARGDFSYLYDKHGNIIGAVLRTRTGVKPLYISVGHKISLASACSWILKLAPKYRLPETTRLADRLASEYKMNKVNR